jgi:hypothetical protein
MYSAAKTPPVLTRGRAIALRALSAIGVFPFAIYAFAAVLDAGRLTKFGASLGVVGSAFIL